ncbi:RHS repeat-associated core domain-containing protein [Chryseobacterium sp. SIMBA_029]|uniref:RHS repeat-associated core domain-containing protein n=3 Tax=Bacteria TaxID=2 RepID=UPI00397BFAC1
MGVVPAILSTDPNLLIYPSQIFSTTTQVNDSDFLGTGTTQMLFKLSLSQYSPYLTNTKVEVFNSYFYYNPENNHTLILYNKIQRHSTVKVADFDGDGISEIFEYRQDGTYHIWKLGQSQFEEIRSGNNVKITDYTISGDFNGDKKIDFLTPDASESSGWNLYLSDDVGFKNYYYADLVWFEPSRVGSPRKKRQTNKSYIGLDTNNDGKSDIMVFESQLWARDGIFDWNNPDSSFGISRLISDGVDADGKVIFRYVTDYTPVELNQNIETLNFSRYGEHYIPIVGNNILQNKIYITHKTKLISIVFEDVTKSALVNRIWQSGFNTDIKYSQLDDSAQTGASDLLYPYFQLKMNPNYYMVDRISQEGRKNDFKYRKFIGHLKGKGMIGFHKTARSTVFADGLENTKVWNGTEIDHLNDGNVSKQWSIRTNNDNQVFPADVSENNTQLLTFKSTGYKSDKLLNGQVVTTVSDADKPKIVRAVLPDYTKTKDFLTNTITENIVTYGLYYLPVQSVVKINGNFGTTTTKFGYSNNLNGVGKDYFIGRPTARIEEKKAYSDTHIMAEYYTYESNRLKTSTTIAGTSIDDAVAEEYLYDDFGNVTQKKSTTGYDDKFLVENAQYDAQGKFVIKKTDNLGLETHITYNDWGQILTEKDPYNNLTTNTYDKWGKLMTSKTNLEGTTTYQYEKLDGGRGTKISELSSDGDQTVTYTGILGQVYKVSTKHLKQNFYSHVLTGYDKLGRKIQISEPYLLPLIEGIEPMDPIKWNYIKYDDTTFPAKTTAISFNGKSSETVVTGNITTVKETHPEDYGRITTKTTDALGNVISATDKGGAIQFFYNAAGNQIRAQYAQNTVTTTYDAWGRKLELNDPSNGIYQYEYTGFGQIRKITSPKGTKEYTFNASGQVITQRDISTDNGQATDKTISFTYDTKGRLATRSGTSKGNAYTSGVTYDAQGRLLSSYETSNGKNFIKKGITYDDKARVISYEQQLHSSGMLTKVTIENVYSSWNGELYQIKDKNTGKILWQLNEADAKGQVLNAKLGESTIVNSYDANGFLSRTQHSSQVKPGILDIKYTFNAIKNELVDRTTLGDFNILEKFTYDDNNRLVSWTDPVTGIKPLNRNVYDAKGRILENDQVGIIKYENAAKIYQPTGMTLNAAGTQNYNNDLIQSVNYNENNDPVFIDGEKGDVAFQYGLTSMRQRVTYGGNFTTDGDGKFTKFYSEDGSFEVLKDNTNNKEKHILYIAGAPYESDIIYMKNFDDDTASFKFLHKDYLGSILAISDEAGNKLEQRHFDAWGNFTHLQIGNGAIITDKNIIANTPLLVDRGYTSHEHFAEVGIIHMNGRLYDPLLRRFLNADENIQDLYNTQNYNKYGYVLNNPLMYNDPSGEFIWWVPIVIAVVSHAVQSYYMNQPMTLDGLAVSLIISYASSVVSYGIGEAFQAAGVVSSLGKFAGVVKHIAHGLSGALQSAVQGESFGSGFLSGFLGSMAGNASAKYLGGGLGAYMATGFVMGGIGAELAGGNFWVGAAIGFSASVFNHYEHQVKEKNMIRSKVKDPDAVPERNMTSVNGIKKQVKVLFTADMNKADSDPMVTETITNLNAKKAGNTSARVNENNGAVTSKIEIKYHNKAFLSNYALAKTILHEFYHAADYLMNRWSMQYYESKVKNKMSGTVLKNSMTDWAEKRAYNFIFKMGVPESTYHKKDYYK